MTTNTTLRTNSKAGNLPAELVDRYIRLAEESSVTAFQPLPLKEWGVEPRYYNRMWQVATMAIVLEKHQDLMVPVTKIEAEAAAKGQDPRKALAQIVITMRDEKLYSWGLILCLFDRSEGFVRKLYADFSGQLDRGTRIGKGGRFVRDEKSLYDVTSHKDGARIDAAVLEMPGKIGTVITAARSQDAAALRTLVRNSSLEPKPVAKKAATKKAATKKEVAA